MKNNKDPWVNVVTIAIYLIIIVKIAFLATSIGHLLLSHARNPTDQTRKFDKKFLGAKSKFEFFFTILMSCLLIFIFTPWYDNTKYMNSEIKFLFYLFGFILILSADWSLYLPKSSIGNVINATIG